MPYLQKKSEKLTTALYMVSDIMPDREPMKWKLRETGVELLSDITLSAGVNPSERMSMLRDIMKKTERVVSFLDITQTTKMLSEMNASVLKKEYLSLKDAIEAEWRAVYERSKNIFSDSFFDVPKNVALPEARTEHVSKPMSAPLSDAPPVTEIKKEEPKMNAPVPAPRLTPSPTFTRDPMPLPARPVSPPVIQKDATPTPSVSQPRPIIQNVSREAIPAEGNHNDRRSIILALLREKPALTVKDIITSIPNVSEKTIQRELLAMVANGTLIKRGERRWSTYSLR